MSATRQINGKLTVINVKTTEDGYKTGHGLLRYVITGQVEKVLEVRVACCGNVDAGKSTYFRCMYTFIKMRRLLGVLTSGDLDDGRGRARVHLFKHKHEIESGRTSSVGMEVMGFDETGQHICQSNAGRKLSWEDVSSHASKVITLLDLAGHEKYLKTTVFGMTGCSPDYVMLIVRFNGILNSGIPDRQIGCIKRRFNLNDTRTSWFSIGAEHTSISCHYQCGHVSPKRSGIDHEAAAKNAEGAWLS